jgi:hypothetical protein
MQRLNRAEGDGNIIIQHEKNKDLPGDSGGLV